MRLSLSAMSRDRGILLKRDQAVGELSSKEQQQG